MKHILKSPILIPCLLLLMTIVHAKEKQIKLEDIERDNLAAEKRAKAAKHQLETPHYNHPHPPSPVTIGKLPPHGTPTPPKMQYGFVPIKAPMVQVQTYNTYQHYGRQQTHQPQYHYAPQQEVEYVTPSSQNYVHSHTQAIIRPTVGYHHLRHQPQQAPSSAPPPQQQVEVTEPVQEVAPHYPTHAYVMHQPQYVQAYEPSYHYMNEAHAPAIQYIVDNSIHPQQQAAQQQYVYVQPAASNNVHSVTDTDGNVQYVMYIPATEAILAYHPSATSIEEQTTAPSPQHQPYLVGTDGDDGKVIIAPTARIQRPVFKHQPTSLLDSYVPSYLQYQYYKQQQQESANAIRDRSKFIDLINAKGGVVKG